MTPTVVVFVRHSADCSHASEATGEGTGEFARDCRCRKWLRYSLKGKQYRHPAKTRSWAEAEKQMRQLSAKLNGDPLATAPSQHLGRTTVEQAIQTFIDSKRNQNFTNGVIKKYERELPRLEAFLTKRSKFFPAEIELSDLEAFRSTWDELYPSSATRQNVQARLRGFLRYCFEAGWITRVPRLSSIKVNEVPTMPLSDEEYDKLLAEVPKEFQESAKANRIHALCQLMRHSGLSIRDAVTLEKNEIQRDTKKKLYRIVTCRQKTGTHVSVPIPDNVAQEILTVLNGNPRYVFWNGNGQEQSAVTNWQHDLRRLFRGAFGKTTDFTPHCLRDTFAVELLQRGVPLEEVSKLLGHESIKTTEKSYAKWVQSRQDRLDELVVGTWMK